ncbi:MAG: DUF739 family protein [Eubacterium sp.]
MYDYSKLRGRIVEKCGTIAEFAKRMDLSERTVSLKLNQKRGFKDKDIEKAITVLDINRNDILPYFFTQKVQ